jgi:hypothetical protein
MPFEEGILGLADSILDQHFHFFCYSTGTKPYRLEEFTGRFEPAMCAGH